MYDVVFLNACSFFLILLQSQIKKMVEVYSNIIRPVLKAFLQYHQLIPTETKFIRNITRSNITFL